MHAVWTAATNPAISPKRKRRIETYMKRIESALERRNSQRIATVCALANCAPTHAPYLRESHEALDEWLANRMEDYKNQIIHIASERRGGA